MDSPIGELALLCYDGSIDDNYSKFMALSCCDLSITEDRQVQLFTVGLGKPLRTDVALQWATSLAEAVMYAHAYELRDKPRPLPSPTPACYNNSLMAKQQMSTVLPGTSSAPASSQASVNGRPPTIKQLTPAEIAVRRKNGHCFYCEEAFTHGPRDVCMHQFIVVIGEEEDLQPPGDAPERTISLHALMGVQPRSECTIQLLIDINSVPLVILLDYGSTQ
jgi:hypothetical protein